MWWNKNMFRYLLEQGANPNGSDTNLCAPISVMAQRGYYQGVKVTYTLWNMSEKRTFCKVTILAFVRIWCRSWGSIQRVFRPGRIATCHCRYVSSFKMFCPPFALWSQTRSVLSRTLAMRVSTRICSDSVFGATRHCQAQVKIFHFFTNSKFIPKLIFRCPKEFIYLFREFGGNFWVRDNKKSLATDFGFSHSGSFTMKQLQGEMRLD